jgi:hypothetical protein
VRRSESIGGDGRPLRRVVIEGADYGLQFARYRISWRQAFGGAVLGNFGELEAVGLDFKPYPAAQFIRDVTEFTINPWLDTFYSQSVSNPEARSVAPVARAIAVACGIICSANSEPSTGTRIRLYMGFTSVDGVSMVSV